MLEMKETLDAIMGKHSKEQSSLISILQEIQKEYRYLPKETLEYVSDKLDISEAKIFGIATFYENFSLEAKGKHIIRVCDGTACHIRKSMPILNSLRKELSLEENKNTTDDLMFTVEVVSCIGACSLAPAVNIDGKVYGHLTPESIVELLNNIKEAD
jgi:NADH-quinone oxidoreductase subunit E